MKIITGRIKDYYDHVATQYGGGDPRVVYDRSRIGEVVKCSGGQRTESKVVTMKEWDGLNAGVRQVANFFGYDRELDWLVVAGKPYPLVMLENYPAKYEILDLEKHRNIARPGGNSPGMPELTRIGVQTKRLIELSRLVGHPVFIINDVRENHNTKDFSIRVEGDYPILKEIGLPPLYPAEQLYQDLAYFMGNTMKISPDLSPPAQMTDLQKVNAHGFDKKISFRHRK